MTAYRFSLDLYSTFLRDGIRTKNEQPGPETDAIISIKQKLESEIKAPIKLPIIPAGVDDELYDIGGPVHLLYYYYLTAQTRAQYDKAMDWMNHIEAKHLKTYDTLNIKEKKRYLNYITPVYLVRNNCLS